MTNTNDNPLLDFSGLPRFDAIAPVHVTPAVDALLAHARTTIDTVASDTAPPSWTTLVEPLDDALDRLDRAWSAGGKADPNPKQDYGFMYGRSFEDPDGHIWEVMWMDVAAAQVAMAKAS